MPALNNSPPPDASSSVRGLVNLVAQTFAGAKTFTSRIVATLGIAAGAAVMELRSDLGAGASDVAVKVGTTVADASAHATAKLLSVSTGLGGSEVVKFYVLKRGTAVIDLGGTTNTDGLTIINAGGGSGAGLSINLPSAKAISLGGADTGRALLRAVNTGFDVAAAGSGVSALRLSGDPGASSSDVAINMGTSVADGSTNAAAALVAVATGVGATQVNKAIVRGSGKLDQSGTDSSGSPGAATINKPTGISAIANAATTVVITNSLATTTSRILLTWLGDHGAARSWVTRAAGSFTVNLSAAAGANTTFAWEVSDLL